jgi:hypothetical protein
MPCRLSWSDQEMQGHVLGPGDGPESPRHRPSQLRILVVLHHPTILGARLLVSPQCPGQHEALALNLAQRFLDALKVGQGDRTRLSEHVQTPSEEKRPNRLPVVSDESRRLIPIRQHPGGPERLQNRPRFLLAQLFGRINVENQGAVPPRPPGSVEKNRLQSFPYLPFHR